VKLNTLWNSEGVTENTRSAIWNYLSTLFLLGTTIRSMPPEILSSVEGIAKDCADKVQNGQLDFASMMPQLMQSMSGLMGGLGNGSTGGQKRLE